jgi:hypothetical protein
MTAIDLHATRESLRSIAAAQMAEYPQYAGRFERYCLVRVKRDVVTKAGQAFTRDEYAIASPVATPTALTSEKFVTVWSRKNQIDTSVRSADVEWL